MVAAVQSPEAVLDRDIEELIGEKVKGTLTNVDQARLVELQTRRSKMMRFAPTARRVGGVYRFFAPHLR